jgi:hypothetical protein
MDADTAWRLILAWWTGHVVIFGAQWLWAVWDHRKIKRQHREMIAQQDEFWDDLNRCLALGMPMDRVKRAAQDRAVPREGTGEATAAPAPREAE